jgi:hypothetical protein
LAKDSGLELVDGQMASYKMEPVIYWNGSWREITKLDSTDGVNDEKDKLANNAYVKLRRLVTSKSPAFKTGGLADFTGPAWLDGTKSKPEIVLNQQDSANFLVLRDILSDILNGTSGLSKSDKKDGNGDNYYDIEINVESLSDDYDVEQLADKIRGMIYDDATYRNVNAINK